MVDHDDNCFAAARPRFSLSNAAATFDEIQLRVDLIGAVNGDIDHQALSDSMSGMPACRARAAVSWEVGTA